MLFVDARNIFRQVTRAHRVFDPDHVEFIGNIVRLWRGEEVETAAGSGPRTADAFPEGRYRDVQGLCRVATLGEVKSQGWSLNPGRYVGAAHGHSLDGGEFLIKLEALHEELEALNSEAALLQDRIAANIAEILAP